jgi:ABC-2 type transport system ATP-binding protein
MLEVHGLTKRFNGLPAVHEVSFTVKLYEVLGYLGPNGSGKTTTAKMLTGLIQPSRGHILFKRRLGYVPEEPYLYPYLTGREYLQLVGRLRCMSQPALDKKIDEFLEIFSIQRERHAALSSYSKGMRQKVLIAVALLHNPDVLIFDEPLSGLDVTSALIFRHLVKSLAGEGKIILYSSHVLEVVEKVCSHVVILHKGRVVAHDSVERLRDLMKLPSLEEIFSQLVLEQDTEKAAQDIVEVMKVPA